MSWFAYQHITHRLGVKSLAALFYEIFGIQVNWWEFLTFRHLLVRRYRKTYNMLLTQLIAGSVLHIDETELKLKDGSGYVWVFASESASVYIFRRSREGISCGRCSRVSKACWSRISIRPTTGSLVCTSVALST